MAGTIEALVPGGEATPGTPLGPEFRIEADDVLIVTGTDGGTNRSVELVE